MKPILVLLFFSTFLDGFAQTKPPGLVYSCEIKTATGSVYEIYNHTGKQILGKPVDWAYSNTWSWIFVLDRKTELVTAYDYHGSYLGIDSVESTQSTYFNGNRVGLKRNGKWGFYNKQGKLTIPHQYDEISHFHNQMAAVKTGGRIFMIDTNGVKIATPYDPSNESYSFDDTDIALGMGGDFYFPEYKKINENGKLGLLEVKTNRILIPAEYDYLTEPKPDFKVITAGKKGRYGLVEFGGRIMIPIQYESVILLNAYF